jgi:hypothetical protein
MSTSRPKLKLDEQSFQDMLAAAFTIQEHNAKRRRAVLPPPVCERCGAPSKEGERLCAPCAGEEFRPGEQMQRKWASLWLMGQEQGLWPERSAEEHESAAPEIVAKHFSETLEIPGPDAPVAHLDEQEEKAEHEWLGTALAELKPPPLPPEIVREIEPAFLEAEPVLEEAREEEPTPAPWNLRDLRLKLRFHRADLYLVVAIVVSTFAMVWVLSATPASGAQHKPRLRLWERALISMGLADAPEPPPRRGNPNIQVWVDPRTALYYCVGEEQYSKTPGGRPTTQREAQLDGFEPASRAPCD